MAHDSSTANMSPTEIEFNDIIRHANDFFKIELLRQAKNWYKKALAFNMETEMVKGKIAECDRMLAYENKVVAIVCSIAAVIIIGYFLFKIN